MSITLAALAGAATLAAAPAQGDAVDRLFQGWRKADDPGCAVAVAKDGRTVVNRAYGRAELEHGIAATPATVFEAGSASKQFTAAVVLLLQKDGRLSLRDDVRKHVPELPDYGRVITVADLLHHTSGLRDWRYVAGVAGNTLGTHVHTNGDALEIIRRQRSLNHATGAEHAYTNSGYTLLAIIVERASGRTLADYSRERIFEPLGMRSTQWRDNFRQVVKGRAVAYARAGPVYEQDMPFEHAHGAGGLLTTTGDLLQWNAALDADRLGVTKALESSGKLADGTPVGYGGGLFLDTQKGARRVWHAGVTAGYRAWVGRFPEHKLSIAFLCNNTEVPMANIARALAEQYLPASLKEEVPGEVAAPAQTEAGEPWRPDAVELGRFSGRYVSEEARATYVAEVQGGRLKLWLEGRPEEVWSLSPARKDRFVFLGGAVSFHRNAAGEPVQMALAAGGIRDLRFDRLTLQAYGWPDTLGEGACPTKSSSNGWWR